jgi:protein-S-isoprenylcysteine O-methyltransferase Ste14
LKIKIPPPLIVVFLTTLVYLSSNFIIGFELPFRTQISILLLLIGLSVLFIPVFQFFKSKTTINPQNFKNVNNLVSSGIFKISRNPMYLGMLIIIMSTVVYYFNYFSVLTPFIFYFWINEFQIKREEKKLEEKFGSDYKKYKSKTRRWI